jgi:signal transduction histidine kinase/ActR/RegA family two-component response regulator
MRIQRLSSAAFVIPIVKALAISLLLAAVRIAIEPLVEGHHEFVPAYVALGAATWFTGWVGGAIAGVVGLLAEASATRLGQGDAIPFMGYTAMCVLLVSSIEWIKSERAEAASLALRVQTSDRRKTDFIAMLGHELRNPLSTIRLASNLLKSAALDGASRDAAWKVLDRQIEHMSTLVGDLLDISRIETGKLTLQRELVGVAELVEEAIGGVLSCTNAKRQHVTHLVAPGGGLVYGDRVRLQQVLVNLLHNASKFSAEEGTITVEVKGSDSCVEIRVRDSGAGIEQDKLDAIFESFVQVEATRAQHGGLGIGLALARTLTQLHDGTLVARSDGLGTGAEFILTLPRAIPPRRSNSALDSDAANESHLLHEAHAPLKLLIVDDNSDAAFTLALLLRDKGHTTFTAEGGKAAIALAEKEQPDAAFIDITLPDMNGFQVAREMRRGGARQPMLVALTGWAAEQDKRRSKAAGFDLHLSKPVSLREIDDALHTCASSRPTARAPSSRDVGRLRAN